VKYNVHKVLLAGKLCSSGIEMRKEFKTKQGVRRYSIMFRGFKRPNVKSALHYGLLVNRNNCLERPTFRLNSGSQTYEYSSHLKKIHVASFGWSIRNGIKNIPD
jgi:hypothetical protein